VRAWMDQAACLDVDPELFFPSPPSQVWGGRYGDDRAQAVKAAIDVCKTCPVAAECLDYGQRIGATTGVWGGFDFDDTRLWRKRHYRNDLRKGRSA
jgi:WhiB family redox-sensing transcriptional regulator